MLFRSNADISTLVLRFPYDLGPGDYSSAVSYTHLDVYKRQGLTGEGDGRDLRGGDTLGLDQPGDAGNQRARLARAGPRDQDVYKRQAARSFDGLDARKVGGEVARRTLDGLNAAPVPAGKYRVVFFSEAIDVYKRHA